LCKIEAPIREISLRLTLYFSTCLSILIYKSSKFGIDFDQDLFFKRISIALFVIFLYLSSSSIFKDSLFTEFKDLNCHYAVVKEQTGVFKYLIAIFYVGIPTAAGLLITLIAYILTFKRLRKLGQGAIQGMGIKPHKLFWYPAVLFLVFIPRIIDGLVKTFRNGEEIFFLKAMHMILTHSIGMANAVVYGLQMKYYYKKYEERDPFSSRLASFLNESLEVPEHNETMISSTRSKKK